MESIDYENEVEKWMVVRYKTTRPLIFMMLDEREFQLVHSSKIIEILCGSSSYSKYLKRCAYKYLQCFATHTVCLLRCGKTYYSRYPFFPSSSTWRRKRGWWWGTRRRVVSTRGLFTTWRVSDDQHNYLVVFERSLFKRLCCTWSRKRCSNINPLNKLFFKLLSNRTSTTMLLMSL